MDVLDWQALGEHSYRKWDLYSLDWNVRLEENLVCGASFGGPIAVVRNPDKMVELRGSSRTSNDLSIYSAAGFLLSRVRLEVGDKVMNLAWTDSEHVVVVYTTGYVELFNVRGEPLDTFFLTPGQEYSGDSHSTVVLHFCVLGESLAAVVQHPASEQVATYVVPDVAEPVVQEVTALPPDTRPTTIAFLDPKNGAPLKLIITLNDRCIATADIDELVARLARLEDPLPSAVTTLAVAPHGRYIAMMGDDGLLSFISSHFEGQRVVIETKASQRPDQMVWCGEDAAVLSWKGKGLLMVGLNTEWLKYSYEGAVHIVQEPDALRIIGDRRHDMVQRVPEPTAAIKELGSTSPGATLHDALAAFDAGDIAADSMIRRLTSDGLITEGIFECVFAAAHEFTPDAQQPHLHAASFGKNYDLEFESDVFVDICRKLRVLNTLRKFDVGIPLTFGQFDILTAEGVLDRLVDRRLYTLALRLADFLQVPKHHILANWATAKIQRDTSVSDDMLYSLLRSKLGDASGVSYAEIASAADAAGRRSLAKQLVAHETSTEAKVNLLLQMRAGEMALETAVGSMDPDLIHLVMQRMRPRLTSTGHARRRVRSASGLDADGDGSDGADDAGGEERKAGARGGAGGPSAADSGDSPSDAVDKEAEYCLMLQRHPPALAMMKKFSRFQDPSFYRRLCSHVGDHVAVAEVDVRGAYRHSSTARRIDALKAGAGCLKTAISSLDSGILSSDKGLSFFQRTIEDHVSLLSLQEQLDSLPRETPVTGLSVSETLYQLVSSGQHAKVEALRTEMRIPDQRFAFIKIRGLVHSYNWSGLAKFVEKKPAVGYEEVVEACIEAGARIQAAAYVPKVTDEGKRIDFYIRLGNWMDAIELAARVKDEGSLRRIISSCSAPAVLQAADSALNSL